MKVCAITLLMLTLGCATHTPWRLADGPLRFDPIDFPPITYVDAPNVLKFTLGGDWEDMPLCVSIELDELPIFGQCGEFELRRFEIYFRVPYEIYALKKGRDYTSWGSDQINPPGWVEPIEGIDENTVHVDINVAIYYAEPDLQGTLRAMDRVLYRSRTVKLECNGCSF